MSGLRVVVRLSPSPISFPSSPEQDALEADARCDWRHASPCHASPSLRGRTHQQSLLLPSSAFPPLSDNSSVLVLKDLAEVCPLSRRMMFQSLSTPLQGSISFFRIHLPESLSD